MKTWRVRYYDLDGKDLGTHIIKNRTENEASKEAIADMPYNCEDWSMQEASPQSKEK